VKPSIVPAAQAGPRTHAGPIQALGRRAMLGLLSRLPDGEITVI